jgi:hypothetical protein
MESNQCDSGIEAPSGLYEARRLVRHEMGAQRIREVEEEIARVRAKLAQLEAQLEKAKECEKKRGKPTADSRVVKNTWREES